MTKVLFCGEASYLSTGYAVYSHEILKRLHKKVDIIEFANYGHKSDPRCNMPWEFYGVLPENEEEKQQYESNPINQFGGYKFEKALLKYKPTHTADCRDVWMNSYQLLSPFRPFYSLLWMPTVDSEPQPDEWVSQYEQCDGIVTYCKWAEQHLRTKSNKIKYFGQASPGADYSLFRPLNKQIRQQVGIPKDAFVIGTTMRNQKRKLFPNLIEAFDKLMDQDASIREKGYLYLHTSWPDMGWNIPELVKNSKYSNRILFTYFCQQCGSVYASTFAEAVSVCKMCGGFSAVTPNSGRGVPREALACIYNCFDLYVQYATQEGLGMPQIEAAACEVPIMATDYSAMTSVVRDCAGYPIEVKNKHLDCEKQTLYAIPDNDDLIYKIRKFYNLPEHEKQRKRQAARKGAMSNYDYDKAADKWLEMFSKTSPAKPWNSPPDIRSCNPPVPPNLNQSDLVEWAIGNILGRHDLIGTFFHTRILRDLHNQAKMSNFGGPTANEMAAVGHKTNNAPYGPNDMLNELASMRDNINRWEQARLDSLPK